jgi:hypothetical protein
MAAEFKYFAIVVFGGLVIFNGLKGIILCEVIFGFGKGKGNLKITLQGNYAIGGGFGLIVAGLLFVLPVMLRNQLEFSDTLDGILFATGFGILIISLVLAATFQWAALLGRDLSKRPTRKE